MRENYTVIHSTIHVVLPFLLHSCLHIAARQHMSLAHGPGKLLLCQDPKRIPEQEDCCCCAAGWLTSLAIARDCETTGLLHTLQGDLGACHCSRHLKASAGSGGPLLCLLGRGGCCCGADTLCWELLLYSDARGHSLLVYMVGRLHWQALHNASHASAAVTIHQAAAAGSACQTRHRSMPSVMSP